MTDKEFSPGDVVVLKSGGPRMTIAAVDKQNALCEWFSDDQNPLSRSFALTSLRLDEQS
ncbi:YodC family protein [Pseudorhodoplanes sp.]|uniref:YodC family protein n=1 Tax=Pseudorhodoplanes sp. TaxID=1934341 RepID=UPI00391CD465